MHKCEKTERRGQKYIAMGSTNLGGFAIQTFVLEELVGVNWVEADVEQLGVQSIDVRFKAGKIDRPPMRGP